MAEYNAIFRLFRFSGTLGQPRDVYHVLHVFLLGLKVSRPLCISFGAHGFTSCAYFLWCFCCPHPKGNV